MKTIIKVLKRFYGIPLALIAIFAMFGFLAVSKTTQASVAPNWDTTGNYVIAVNYLGSDYAHDLSLTQDNAGNLTGSGGNPAGGTHTYQWELTSGLASGDTIDFLAQYTASADAVTPLTIMHMTGNIAIDGKISGEWSDNYQGGTRSGTWSTTTGQASLLGTLAAEDFGVVNYDTGLGMLKGYTAGFGLTDATFAGATSVVVKLYDGENLLQTNTAILPKFNADITGTQFSSPFDVSGNFQYATDGYWTNVRETQYGQSVPATKVIATVTLANGKVVTATNTNVTGDATTIYPIVIPILTNKDQCKDDGWKIFTNPSFSNQGQCVSYIESNRHSSSGSRSTYTLELKNNKGIVLGVFKFNFTENMRRGSRGNEVIEIQKFLTALGFNLGMNDGIFGARTESALRNFQSMSGLKSDGIVGPHSRAMLNR